MKQLYFFINPSNQPANLCADGTHNEKAEMTKVANMVADALIRCGQKVDVGSSMEGGIAKANAAGVDQYTAIHSNASGNHTATGPRVYYGQDYDTAKAVLAELQPVVGGQEVEPIQKTSLREINGPKCPSILVETYFHDNSTEHAAMLCKYEEIAEAIAKGLCKANGIEYVPPGTAVLDAAKEGKFTMEDAQNWAVAAGLFRGDDNGKMNWKEPLTRSQAAMLLYRFYKGFIKTLG